MTAWTPTITGLYVPGNRPDRFDKAVATGAQLVILDLEDAVPPAEKTAARTAVAEWLARRAVGSGPKVQVRVNAGDDADLSALHPLADRFTLRLPKVDRANDLEHVAPFPGVVPVIESALGVENAREIASHPAVSALAMGDSDLASDVGSTSEQILDYARIRLVFAARAAGLPAPMMSVWPRIPDLEGLRTDSVRGASLGMVGRVAIHPSQLAVIADSFRPPASDVEWAREVLAALDSGGVATLAAGDMVDPAMLGRARSILALADAAASPYFRPASSD